MQTATAFAERELFDTTEPETPYRETGEGLTDFGKRAAYMAQRGVRVTPVWARSKKAFLTDWQVSATCDLHTIAGWHSCYRNYNTGCVADLDTLWLLDADDPGIPARYEQDTGQQFPTTFTVESSPGHRHYYFRPSPASCLLGNVGQNKAKPLGDVGQNKVKPFSVRANNQYVVGPGSVHPAGDIYRIVDDAEFAQVPDTLIDWIKAQIGAQEQPRPDSGVPPAAGKKIPEGGGRNCHLTSVAGRLHRDRLPVEQLLPALLSLNQTDCDPPLPEAEVRSIATSIIGNYDQPVEEPDIQIAEEPLPVFPVIPGTIGELSEALSSYLPTAFKVMAAVTRVGLLLSGKTFLEGERYLQSRFYTCFIAPPWCGKSASLNDVGRLLNADFETVPSIDSGPALVETFHDMGKGVYGEVPRRLLLNPDEIRDVFEKAKAVSNSRNSLLKEYITLFQNNEIGSRTVGRGVQEVSNAHLAIIGGAQPEVYDAMWSATGSGASGLQSRFVLAAADKRVPEDQGYVDEKGAIRIAAKIYAQVAAAPPTIRFLPESRKRMHDWWNGTIRDKGSEDRIPDHVKRLMIVLAVTNGLDAIEPWLMEIGIQFGNYQIALRERYNPGDTYTWVQDCENKITAALERHGAMTLNQLVRLLTPAKRIKGGYETFNRALRSLEGAGVIVVVGHTQRSKKYGLA
jgi:hypothetical protein